MGSSGCVDLKIATELRPGVDSGTVTGFVYWYARARWHHRTLAQLTVASSPCRWQMDFQGGDVSYCTRSSGSDGCSFKLAAYRVPPVLFSEGQHLRVQVKLDDSTAVTFRAAV
jgi:hypothetical protein